MDNYSALFELIDRSSSFDEVRSSGLLPEPDSDDGYYFVSYSHRDYKAVLKDIAAMRDAGVRVWYDRGLESGKSWIREVKQKMSSYYCKGVIVYLSDNYLMSHSCMMELDHLIMNTEKGALFIPLDGSVSDSGIELQVSAMAFELPSAFEGVLARGELFTAYRRLPVSSPLAERLDVIRAFPEPQLLEYTFLHGIGTIGHNITDFILGRVAAVSGVADKNVRRVVIPSTVMHDGREYRVCIIQKLAFFQCDLLEEVVVSDGWLSIEDHAFSRCASLRRVTLGRPRSLLMSKQGVVGDVFDRCPMAKLVSSSPIISNAAFKGDDKIRIARHEDETRWYGQSFLGCSNLELAELRVGDNFGDRMFQGCVRLREVGIPPRLKYVQRMVRSFEGCESLESISLPRCVREIGERSFAGCKSLKSVLIPRRVRYIERDAFLGCDALETVTVDAKKMRNYIDHPYFPSHLLDELIPAAKTFYLRHVPRRLRVFEGNFTEVKSDKKGYRKFVKESV